jgi:hypothetical protein
MYSGKIAVPPGGGGIVFFFIASMYNKKHTLFEHKNYGQNYQACPLAFVFIIFIHFHKVFLYSVNIK